ncbi:family 20 glycosylhydrolase [Verrucomicrobiota bacterium]
MKVNGLMIDCSRLMERHEYYRRLVDFMADWGMNALVLHFSDDFGLAVRLPGFGSLAMPRAFSTRDIRNLTAHAKSRGIDIIPELEVFGHTRYLTDHPDYAHLFAGRKTRRLLFNAIDPLNAETLRLMRKLIRSTAKVFPSDFLHLGCDEVNLKDYCRERGMDEADVWTDYVNAMAGEALAAGKKPMIWGDHPAADGRIAAKLRKDLILVEWRYTAGIRDTVLPVLERAGFTDFIVAPSLACYSHRFLPPEAALENTKRMARIGARHRVMGLVNTIWCPWRYLQNALYYGIAYSALSVRGGGPVDKKAFHGEFAAKVLGTELARPLDRFLTAYPKMSINNVLARKIASKNPAFIESEWDELRRVNTLGRRALPAAEAYTPKRNADIWEGMVLACLAAWLCSEWCLLRAEPSCTAERRAAFNALLRSTRRRLDAEWDRTRYADDPQKRRTAFPDHADQYALVLMKRLSYLK